MDINKVFWQGSLPWGPKTLLGGPDDVAKSGCYEAALCHAVRRILKQDITPGDVNDKATRNGHYQSDRIEIEPACGSWGLHAPDLFEKMANPSGARQLMLEVCNAIHKGGCAFLHFDLNDDGKGDHWTLAWRIDEAQPAIWFADSALAREECVGSYRGETWLGWNGKAKHYVPVACRPVYASAAAP